VYTMNNRTVHGVTVNNTFPVTFYNIN